MIDENHRKPNYPSFTYKELTAGKNQPMNERTFELMYEAWRDDGIEPEPKLSLESRINRVLAASEERELDETECRLLRDCKNTLLKLRQLLDSTNNELLDQTNATQNELSIEWECLKPIVFEKDDY